jgi:large subunit ribosomal protein L19e
MNVKSHKQMAARIMKVGVSRVRVTSDKDVEDAITRNDVKTLISRGLIYKVQRKGVAKADANFTRKQKKKGRRSGPGRRKGRLYAKKSSKDVWIDKVRPLRRMLRELRDGGELEKRDYRKMYLMVKGGAFRNKKHLMYYLKDKELIKLSGKAAEGRAASAEKRSAARKSKKSGESQ